MHLGNVKIHQDHMYTFEIDDVAYILENIKSERDLGVQLQDNLKWNNQISTSVLKANFVLGRLKKSFEKWDTRTFKVLFTSYVRPIIEYGSTIWNPYRKQDIRQIENVQRRATKLVPAIRNKSYEDRLEILGLTTLEERRKRGDPIQYFKINKKIILFNET